MTFVAFLVWVVILAGTGYMLWKLVFQGRTCKKEDAMAVKTDQASAGKEKEEEFHSDVVAAEEVSQAAEETPEQPETVEEEIVEELEEVEVIDEKEDVKAEEKKEQ